MKYAGRLGVIIDAASFPGTPADVMSEIDAILGRSPSVTGGDLRGSQVTHDGFHPTLHGRRIRDICVRCRRAVDDCLHLFDAGWLHPHSSPSHSLAVAVAGRCGVHPWTLPRCANGFCLRLHRAALQAVLDAAVKHDGLPGVTATVLVADGGAWSGAAGTADGVHPVKVRSQFSIASITKTVIAAEIMRLSEQGMLRSERPRFGAPSTELPLRHEWGHHREPALHGERHP